MSFALVMGAFAALSPLGMVGAIAILLSFPLMWIIVNRPIWIVLFLTAFMPFENLILKYLPGPENIYIASRFISEILIYLTLVSIILKKLLTGKKIRRSPIDGYIIAFIMVAFLSIFVNRSPVGGSLVNLRSIFRYLALFYLVINIKISPKHLTLILRTILTIGFLEILIGFLQLIFGRQINEFLLPRETVIEIAGFSRGFNLVQRGREVGAIFGTLGDTVFFALFMLIVLVILLGGVHRINLINSIILIAIFVVINFAYTRAVVFSTILILLIYYRLKAGLNRVLRSAIIMIPIGLFGISMLASTSQLEEIYINPGKEQVSIFENITGIFTIDYFRRAQYQRLGALAGIPPTVLASKPFFGFGPNEEFTIARLNESRPSFLFRTVVKNGFEDVYWVAILSYYGLIGLIIVILLLNKLYQSSKLIAKSSSQPQTKALAVSVCLIVSITPFLLFFYRVLEFRIFSFYFWLLAGLIFSKIDHGQTQMNETLS
jgi:hypothetical protein